MGNLSLPLHRKIKIWNSHKYKSSKKKRYFRYHRFETCYKPDFSFHPGHTNDLTQHQNLINIVKLFNKTSIHLKHSDGLRDFATLGNLGSILHFFAKDI